jgi:hypothetical protein
LVPLHKYSVENRLKKSPGKFSRFLMTVFLAPHSCTSMHSRSVLMSYDMVSGQWSPTPGADEEFESVIYPPRNSVNSQAPAPILPLLPKFAPVVLKAPRPQKGPSKRKLCQGRKIPSLPRLRSSSPSSIQTISQLARSPGEEIGEKPVIKYRRPEFPRRAVRSAVEATCTCVNN